MLTELAKKVAVLVWSLKLTPAYAARTFAHANDASKQAWDALKRPQAAGGPSLTCSSWSWNQTDSPTDELM